MLRNFEPGLGVGGGQAGQAGGGGGEKPELFPHEAGLDRGFPELQFPIKVQTVRPESQPIVPAFITQQSAAPPRAR